MTDTIMALADSIMGKSPEAAVMNENHLPEITDVEREGMLEGAFKNISIKQSEGTPLTKAERDAVKNSEKAVGDDTEDDTPKDKLKIKGSVTKKENQSFSPMFNGNPGSDAHISTLEKYMDSYSPGWDETSESNARITAKRAMQGEPPTNARQKRAVRAKLNKSPSKQKKAGLDVAAAAYESNSLNDRELSILKEAHKIMTRLVNEQKLGKGTEDRIAAIAARDKARRAAGKPAPKPAASLQGTTTGQPDGAESTGTEKLIKKVTKGVKAASSSAARKAATAHGDTNEATGIGGRWDTPSQKYSANRMRDFTPPTPEQVKKERDRRLKAGLNADGSKKTKGDTNEATDDRGRLIPGSAADSKSKITIGKFRSQPGAGPGQAARNAAAAKTAKKKANEGSGGIKRLQRKDKALARDRNTAIDTQYDTSKSPQERQQATKDASDLSDKAVSNAGPTRPKRAQGENRPLLRKVKALNASNTSDERNEMTSVGAIGVSMATPSKLKKSSKKKRNEANSMDSFLCKILTEVKEVL